eukprot:6210492-Alexandrium_andersonii.AAC.1
MLTVAIPTGMLARAALVRTSAGRLRHRGAARDTTTTTCVATSSAPKAHTSGSRSSKRVHHQTSHWREQRGIAHPPMH